MSGASHALKRAGAVVLGLVLLILLFLGGLLLLGGNWLREPVARAVLDRTGRALTVEGDVRFSLGWPALKIRAGKVTFGNPAWATRAPHLLSADEVELGVLLPQLLGARVALDELRLANADISLEKDAEGRRNWLLDLEQKDEQATVPIGRLALRNSRIAYDEPPRRTSIQVDVSSAGAETVFSAKGRYAGMPLSAKGTGGSLLGLRDESLPYPFRIDAAIGKTKIKAEGSVTGLSRITALDMKVTAEGDSLSGLFPLVGITLPETPGYRTAGQLEHAGTVWRYQKFTTRVGNSDFAGTIEVDAGRQRPLLRGNVDFGKLDMADLGPVIGTSRTEANGEPDRREEEETSADGRVLPKVPFRTERWKSIDADVKLTARSIVRPHELPLERFAAHWRLRDAVLTLDPLSFGIAGGELAGAVTLDGRQDPIKARARVSVNKIALDRMFPGFDKSLVDAGRVEGEIDLAGTGNSVAEMLGTASGSAALIVAGGHVSRLAMEAIGLHIPEIIALKMGGDKAVPIRCGAAEFGVDKGIMRTRMLVFDTAVTTIGGSGDVDLADERLDLTLTSRTKQTSLVSLRSPVHIRGSFAKPAIELETGRIAAKSLGAAALAAANPLLLLVPLIDRGPGKDSDCGRLFSSAGMAGKAGGAPAK